MTDPDARIAAWVAEQMRDPWPLTAEQRALIRRVLRPTPARPPRRNP